MRTRRALHRQMEGPTHKGGTSNGVDLPAGQVRPIRDGGRKPSPGRTPPPLRPHSPLAEKGHLILTKVQTFTKDFRHSISQHDKQHPFPEALLCEVRHILVGPRKDTIDPGQPFYLEAIHDLAKQMNDADQDYPLTLRGSPTGCL